MKAEHLDAAVRFLEKHPRLGAMPTPAFLVRALDRTNAQRSLVLKIAICSDQRTAFAALWYARALAISNPFDSSVTIERVLEAIYNKILSGDLS